MTFGSIRVRGGAAATLGRDVTGGGADHRGQLTDRQVELLLKEIAAHSDRIREVLDLMIRLAAAGGRDWEDYERVLDGLANRASG